MSEVPVPEAPSDLRSLLQWSTRSLTCVPKEILHGACKLLSNGVRLSTCYSGMGAPEFVCRTLEATLKSEQLLPVPPLGCYTASYSGFCYVESCDMKPAAQKVLLREATADEKLKDTHVFRNIMERLPGQVQERLSAIAAEAHHEEACASAVSSSNSSSSSRTRGKSVFEQTVATLQCLESESLLWRKGRKRQASPEIGTPTPMKWSPALLECSPALLGSQELPLKKLQTSMSQANPLKGFET